MPPCAPVKPLSIRIDQDSGSFTTKVEIEMQLEDGIYLFRAKADTWHEHADVEGKEFHRAMTAAGFKEIEVFPKPKGGTR